MPWSIAELHNIMPLENIPSVLRHGLLSHAQASRLPHVDVSMSEIQDRRDRIQVPQGLKLHQYANLYFHARNPMLFKRKEQADTLCILRVSPAVFDIPGTIITDQNASSNYVKFLPPTALNQLQLDNIYAEDWRHPDQITYWKQKSQKCAEVLVPHRITSDYFIGAYVVSEKVQEILARQRFPYPIDINPFLFFR
ncbi:MAG: DUF4433 domain-containing protein [Anaerolineae bacterium]|nr:DUF4433 domain-containing protein [Anaerolineae bacterium]